MCTSFFFWPVEHMHICTYVCLQPGRHTSAFFSNFPNDLTLRFCSVFCNFSYFIRNTRFESIYNYARNVMSTCTISLARLFQTVCNDVSKMGMCNFSTCKCNPKSSTDEQVRM